MKVNSVLKTHLQNCHNLKHTKLVNFIPDHKNVWMQDLSMTKCYQTYYVEPIPTYWHVSDNYLQSLAEGQNINT